MGRPHGKTPVSVMRQRGEEMVTRTFIMVSIKRFWQGRISRLMIG